MKQPRFSLFLLAFLLVSNFCLHAYGEYVYDSDGASIRTGGSFYYVGQISPGSGGVTPTPVFSDTCPRLVVQSPDPDCFGVPITFSSSSGYYDRRIQTDTDLIFQFAQLPFQLSCPEPQVWTIEQSNTSSDDYFVTTIGRTWAAGRPRSLPSLFKIQKVKNGGYQFRYCPSASAYLCDAPSCKDSIFPCDNIGISEQNGKRRLALGGEPFQIVFRKATNYYFAETS